MTVKEPGVMIAANGSKGDFEGKCKELAISSDPLLLSLIEDCLTVPVVIEEVMNEGEDQSGEEGTGH